MKNKTLSAIVACSILLLVQDVDSIVSFTPGTAVSTRRIIHGVVAEPNDFLYAVQLYYERDLEASLCAGSIINNHFILTAAHCVFYHPCAYIQIYPSTWIPGDQQRIHADWCYPHNLYHGGFYFYDIALVRTQEDLLVSGDLREIPLPEPNMVYEPGDYAIIVGWGMMEDNSYPGQLMLAHMRVDFWDHCNAEYQAATECADGMNCPVSVIPNHSMCTIGIPPYFAGTCLGDGGAPTVIAGVLAAVASGSIMRNEVCETGTPSLLIKVTEFLPWIYLVSSQRFEINKTVAEKSFDQVA